MSNSRRPNQCRWCGREHSGYGRQGCCGEKCFREWITANPNGIWKDRLSALVGYAIIGGLIICWLSCQSTTSHK